MKRSPIDDLAGDLADLAARSLLRVPRVAPSGSVTMCSNDYLGLAEHPIEAHAAPGAGASRLVSGNTDAHEALETALADWLGVEACLAFTSGYAANLGALSCLVRPGDRVLSDALNHASIIDGLRLARANVEVVPHLDLAAAARFLAHQPTGSTRTWFVTESYFSMDADLPQLSELSRLCQENGAALYVDEAHALGVFGPNGRGACAAQGVVPDVLVGTFGKSFGLAGAFVGGKAVVRQWLWNRARSFVFSTGMSPLLAAGASRRLPIIAKAERERTHLLALGERLRSGLRALGCDIRGEGPIVPWVISDPAHALRLANALNAGGYFVQAIRPPTVPEGTSRIRLTVTAGHQMSDVTGFLRTVAELKESWGGWSS